jgi:hypothetical protein
VRMRFRMDSWHYADLKVAMTWEQYTDGWSSSPTEEDKRYWDETPKAEPGDVWRIHWSHHDPIDGPQIDDRIAGYAICCIGCGHVHAWTTAGNCNQKIQCSYKDSNTGLDVPYTSCVHSGLTSCWNWTGSAEEGTLTATPSLQVTQDECKWHGYITNGDIHV